MITTTVISPSPTRLTIPPPSQRLVSPETPMENAGEKFPSFEDTRSEDKLHTIASPLEISPSINSLPVNNWPPRKSSQTGWEYKNGGGLQKHRPKRSVSEAFDNFRQRRGSISANTQELAEALKAPISYKLIVSMVRSVRE
jgi:solute carrier family 35, member E1